MTDSDEDQQTVHAAAGDLTSPLDRSTAWTISLAALTALLFSSILMVEKLELLKNPDYRPTCTVDEVLACGNVMTTPQAEVFGFANPLLGIAGFAILVTAGVALLAGARFAQWFWFGLYLGATFAVGFVTWLMYESLYEIGSLCPYCMVVWSMSIIIFVQIMAHIFQPYRATAAVDAFVRYRVVIMVVWHLVIVALILARFWDHWMTYL